MTAGRVERALFFGGSPRAGYDRGVLRALVMVMLFASGCVTTQGASSGGSVIEIIEVDAPEGELVAHVRPVDTVAPDADVEVEPDVEVDPEEDEEPELTPPPKGHVLEGLHPELKKRGLALLERLHAEGIHVKLLMGYTPYKKRTRIGPGGWANWHEFGLAFDLNLTKRKSLSDAKAHFDADAKVWARVGAIALELGLVWGGSWRSSYDPFHFEWHPGADAVINKQDLAAMLRLTGKNGKKYQRAWALYDSPEASRN